MDKLIGQFSNQLKEAIKIGKEINPINLEGNPNIQNILACGLGGSGIGGEISKLLFDKELKIPFNTVNDYSIPGFVDEHTLVIATSYSGNTEETLAALNECINRKAMIVVITSGGALLALAKKNNWQYYLLPSGEQPRAMLAYSLVQQMYILSSLNLIDLDVENEVSNVVQFLDDSEKDIKEKAKNLAQNISGLTPVIYSDTVFEGVAIRFRQQINENSKMLCWHAVLPEMNHNELVGWAGGNDKHVVIKLNSSFEHYRTQKRWEFCKERIEKLTPNIYEIDAKGETLVAQALYLIHLTDWVSLYLAELKNIDPVEVNIIASLKSKLANLK